MDTRVEFPATFVDRFYYVVYLCSHSLEKDFNQSRFDYGYEPEH